MYKLFVSDLDGTLLTTEKTISEPNKEAINEAVANGITVVLASGRPKSSVARYAQELGLTNNPHVSDNGSVIFHHDGTTEILDEMDVDDKRALIELCRREGRQFIAETPDIVYYEMNGPNLDYMMKVAGEVDFRQTGDALREKGIVKVCVFFDTPEDQKRLQNLSFPNSKGLISMENLMDFMPKHIDKYRTLCQLAAELGIPEEEMAIIGDSDNDQEMVREAALGACVKNASEATKSGAKIILDKTNDEDAVAYFIHHYLLT